MGGEFVLLRHDDNAGPGWLLDRCVARVDYFRAIKVAAPKDLPPPNECNGVVFTSHSLDPAALAAKDPLLREEVIFVRTLIGLGVPYLGIDGGAQLLARAVLGKVLETTDHSLGADTIPLREEAASDPLFGGVEALLAVRWPTHRVSLPSRAAVLAGDDDAPLLFRGADWAYGALMHPEATPLMFSDWLDELDEPPPNRSRLVEEVKARQEDQKKLTFSLMNRFIDRTACFCHYEPPVNDQSKPIIPL